MTGCRHDAVGSLLAWFRRAGADLPWRRTRDRWAVLVAEAQLQATQVARVVPYYERFIARWPTPAAMAGEPLGNVLAAWHGLGYPRRARNLHAAARAVAERGWPPADRLQELPGVGPYTAAALRCFADGEAVLPVDTNVRRVEVAGAPGVAEPMPGREHVAERGGRHRRRRRPARHEALVIGQGARDLGGLELGLGHQHRPAVARAPPGEVGALAPEP